MRQAHYFLVGVILLVPALMILAGTGMTHDGSDRHLWVGLFTACLAIALHTLLIMFLIITGRVLREAMRARPLGPEFLEELNVFFAEKKAYPLAILGASSIVAAGVLGFSQRGFGISPTWHMAIGLGAVLLNLWTLPKEYAALRSNQRLIDRAANRLDEIDRESEEEELDPNEPDPGAARRLGIIIAISSWLPYLYWVVIEHGGKFDRVSVHPWLEGCLFGVFLYWLGVRAGRPAPSGPPADPS